VVINGQNVLTLVDHGLFAVQVDDVGGVITAEPLVRLRLPEIAGIDPNIARFGSFSPIAFGDRLALVASSSSASVVSQKYLYNLIRSE
jgi:hypothetical protein